MDRQRDGNSLRASAEVMSSQMSQRFLFLFFFTNSVLSVVSHSHELCTPFGWYPVKRWNKHTDVNDPVEQKQPFARFDNRLLSIKVAIPQKNLILHIRSLGPSIQLTIDIDSIRQYFSIRRSKKLV